MQATLRNIKARALKPAMQCNQNPWPFTLGVELTYVAADAAKQTKQADPNYRFTDWADFDAAKWRFKEELEAHGNKPRTFHTSTDCGCIEVATLPYVTWQAFSKTAMWYHHAAKRYGMGHTALHCAGGGAHIHVGLSDYENKDAICKAAFRDMYKRPYITRAFSYWADADNAPPLAHGEYERWSEKYRVIRCKGGINTLEFRCFQMPAKPQEHELHIAFVVAYMSYIETLAAGEAEPIRLPAPDKALEQWQQDSEAFISFVAALGLPAKQYRRYCKNIEYRAWYAGKHRTFSY